MPQLKLFPEPILIKVDITDNVRSELETIALRAAREPLLAGESYGFTPAERFNAAKDYLSGKVSGVEHYLITYESKTIGYAAVWDGWLAVEANYLDPSIEIAFVEPEFRQWGPSIHEQFTVLLEQVESQRW